MAPVMVELNDDLERCLGEIRSYIAQNITVQ